MKKKIIVWILVSLFIIVDVAIALYPYVSDYVNSNSQSRVVAHYFDDVARIDETKTQEILEAAQTYNQTLLRKSDRFIFSEEETTEYNGLLNTGVGVMGVLSIDKINVQLPIYHGSDEGVLQVGLGHMQGTSLPVGGIGTHAFITGHRGLPSSTLLTDLNRIVEGDTFILYVMRETLTYQVDQIQTVLPDEVEALDIDPKMDYCTLVTCTPYGINTHRLLVRGHRIENAASTWEALGAGARRLDKIRTVALFLIPVGAALAVYVIMKSRKTRREEDINQYTRKYAWQQYRDRVRS